MMYLHKKTNTVYFDADDLKALFEAPSRAVLEQKIKELGLPPGELFADEEKIKEILNSLNLIKDKEDVEIFTALYSMLNFYPGAKIGFPLKDGINLEKDIIDSIEKLKRSTKEDDLTDVYLMQEDGVRAFQLKAYKGSDNSDELYDFIVSRLKHYGFNLEDVNLIITLQCGGDIGNLKLEELHEKLKAIGIKGAGHILLSYNEKNITEVIVTVYPSLGSARIHHKKFSKNEYV